MDSSPQQGQAQQSPTANQGAAPLVGPESILAVLAALSLGGGMGGGQPQVAPQQAKEGTAVGQASTQSILPQLLAHLATSPTAAPQMAGKGVPSAQQAQPNQTASGAQEPVALSVLRMLGMVRGGLG